jgi:hypothetical protein
MLSIVERLQCLSVEYAEHVTIHGVPASKPSTSIRLNQRYPESRRQRRRPEDGDACTFMQPACLAPQSTRQYLGSYIISLGQAQGIGRQIRT